METIGAPANTSAGLGFGLLPNSTTFSSTASHDNPSPAILRHTLTRYEVAKIVGMRMEQLQHGAAPCVDIPEGQRVDVRSIALRELREKKMPFLVGRPLPDGREQKISLSEVLL